MEETKFNDKKILVEIMKKILIPFGFEFKEDLKYVPKRL